jgi:anti-sigma factor RsiW
MTTPNCDWLDDYLDGDLPARSQREFAGHVAECRECRQAIDDSRNTHRLLKLATEQLEIPTGELVDRIVAGVAAGSCEIGAREGANRGSRKARKRRAAALVAACLVFGALVWPGANRNARIRNGTSDRVENVNIASIGLLPSENLTFPEDVIGVPIDTGDPNVTAVWLYSTNAPVEGSH